MEISKGIIEKLYKNYPVEKCAQMLGVSRTSFYQLMKKFNVKIGVNRTVKKGKLSVVEMTEEQEEEKYLQITGGKKPGIETKNTSGEHKPDISQNKGMTFFSRTEADKERERRFEERMAREAEYDRQQMKRNEEGEVYYE